MRGVNCFVIGNANPVLLLILRKSLIVLIVNFFPRLPHSPWSLFTPSQSKKKKTKLLPAA